LVDCSGVDMVSEREKGLKKKTTWLNGKGKLENLPSTQHFLLR